MKTYIKTIYILFTILLATSCAIKPLKSEYNFIDTETTVDVNNLGNGKVLIFNAVDKLRQLGEKGSLNVWVNSKPLVHLKEREYVIIDLKKGLAEFKILHVNGINVKNIYDIEIDENIKIIRLEPTSFSNRINIVNELPSDFGKFKYAKRNPLK